MSKSAEELREELLRIRAELGDLETESKPFTPDENIRVRQVYGSSAAAGSGAHHTFRKSRQLEIERLRAMDREWDEKVAQLEFEKEKMKKERELEEQRLKKRAKRLKRAENRRKFASQKGKDDKNKDSGSHTEDDAESNSDVESDITIHISTKDEDTKVETITNEKDRSRKPGISLSLDETSDCDKVKVEAASPTHQKDAQIHDTKKEQEADNKDALAAAKARLLAQLEALKGT